MNNARWCVVCVVALVVHGLGAVLSGQPGDADASRVFERGAVAADHPVASEAGAKMLRLGGNAVDAAVATSFALSVVRPESCGIGGGGFMVICLPDDPTHGRVVTAINYRETAPGGASPDMFETTELSEASTRSGLAVAVPGTVAGLLHALERYGTLDRATVLQPAIDAAVGGYATDQSFAAAARAAVRRLGEQPSVTDSAIWNDVLARG
ncbi:MAG: gamma-glutamyltransferase, partial [Phycisphaerales bacterium JB041]